jgi:hypothetical protein
MHAQSDGGVQVSVKLAAFVHRTALPRRDSARPPTPGDVRADHHTAPRAKRRLPGGDQLQVLPPALLRAAPDRDAARGTLHHPPRARPSQLFVPPLRLRWRRLGA